MQSIQNELFRISETDIKFEPISDEGIWESLSSNFEKTIPFIEETVNRWSQRTITTGKKPVNILDQVAHSLNDKKTTLRTQVIKEDLKILGDTASASNIFNDHDLYTSLLSDYLAMHDDAPTATSDGDYLYGADLSLT